MTHGEDRAAESARTTTPWPQSARPIASRTESPVSQRAVGRATGRFDTNLGSGHLGCQIGKSAGQLTAVDTSTIPTIKSLPGCVNCVQNDGRSLH